MNTTLALLILASAYGLAITTMYRLAKSMIKSKDRIIESTRADRVQLAQALKEAQNKLNHVKVTRDPKTGRMVSAKKK